MDSYGTVLQGTVRGETAAEVSPRDVRAEDRLRFALAYRLETPVWVYDIDNSRVHLANQAACVLWKAQNETELISRDMSTDMSSTVRKRLLQYQQDFIASNATFNEMWTLYPGGAPTSVMVQFGPHVLSDGRMAMLCEVSTEGGNQPENLRSAEALLHTDVMIALFAVDGPTLYMNPAARNAAPAGTQTLRSYFADPDDHDHLFFDLDGQGEARRVCRVNTAAGPRWHDISARLCSDAATGAPAVLVTASDVSELKTARDKASYLAERDLLTGCFNRAYLTSYMQELARRRPGVCAAIYIDVDRFKQINDRFGHEAGDAVLRVVADRLRAGKRAMDVVARLGGDEFVVILEDAPAREVLESRVEAMSRALSSPISFRTKRLSISASVGVTYFLPVDLDLEAALRHADIALYASKQGGRNRATFYSAQLGREADERAEIEFELKHAIENQDFVLHYQPRIDLRSGRPVSVEALVRWQHPSKGLIMPGKFIPICEEIGLIEDLGQVLLSEAFEESARLREEAHDISLSLNISPRQFADPRLMAALRDHAPGVDTNPGGIELELTESVLIGDHDAIAEKLRVITDLGYRIAIDDFGTGYSNLAYISRFPLEVIKIDGTFTRQLPKSGPIVTLILTLARQIGAKVVAEGVETEEQLSWLKSAGCDQAQGYLLSRPLDRNNLRDWLANSGPEQ